MSLPNANLAEVSQEKIVDYLLNPLHPDGAGKASFFANLGFPVDQWQLLEDALRQLAAENPVAREVDSPHGTKYVVEGELTGPVGRKSWVRTVWIVDVGTVRPRLVTAYPTKH